jgi:hypothetical protein
MDGFLDSYTDGHTDGYNILLYRFIYGYVYIYICVYKYGYGYIYIYDSPVSRVHAPPHMYIQCKYIYMIHYLHIYIYSLHIRTITISGGEGGPRDAGPCIYIWIYRFIYIYGPTDRTGDRHTNKRIQ